MKFKKIQLIPHDSSQIYSKEILEVMDKSIFTRGEKKHVIFLNNIS